MLSSISKNVLFIGTASNDADGYIENITVPEYVESSPILDNVRENNGNFVLAKNRNEIFYEILKLSEKEIAQVEDKWTFPRYKMKSKKLALEV